MKFFLILFLIGVEILGYRIFAYPWKGKKFDYNQMQTILLLTIIAPPALIFIIICS